MSPLTFAFEYPFVDRRGAGCVERFIYRVVILLSYAYTNGMLSLNGARRLGIVFVRKVSIVARVIAACIVRAFLFSLLCVALITSELTAGVN